MIHVEIAKTEDDLSEALNLLTMLYEELGEERESLQFLTLDLIKEMTSTERSTIFLAKSDKDKSIGLLTLTESQAIYAGGQYGVIDEMMILPEYRNQKIGKLLLSKAIFLAQVKGWKRIDVTAPTEGNEAARRFYEQNGFVFTGPKLKLTM